MKPRCEEQVKEIIWDMKTMTAKEFQGQEGQSKRKGCHTKRVNGW